MIVHIAHADQRPQNIGRLDLGADLTGRDRAIQTGDYVSIDLVASIDGEQIEAGSAKGMSYEVGSGDLVDGLDEAIVGKSAGDNATFTATLQQGETGPAVAWPSLSAKQDADHGRERRRREFNDGRDSDHQRRSPFPVVQSSRRGSDGDLDREERGRNKHHDPPTNHSSDDKRSDDHDKQEMRRRLTRSAESDVSSSL